jgi:hypothetical protein
MGNELHLTQEHYIIIIITMAQQLRPPLSEVTGSCAFVAVGDWPTGRAAVLSILMWPPEPSGRQSGDLGEKLPEFCLRNISIHARKVLLHAVNLRHGTDGFTCPPKEVVLRIFITLKNPSTSVGIEPANLGSSTLTTSPPRSTYHMLLVWSKHVWLRGKKTHTRI